VGNRKKRGSNTVVIKNVKRDESDGGVPQNGHSVTVTKRKGKKGKAKKQHSRSVLNYYDFLEELFVGKNGHKKLENKGNRQTKSNRSKMPT